MSGKLIWVVRLIGIVVFLVLVYLLLSLHTRLVQMNEGTGGGGRPLASGTDCELRIANCEMTGRVPADGNYVLPLRVASDTPEPMASFTVVPQSATVRNPQFAIRNSKFAIAGGL